MSDIDRNAAAVRPRFGARSNTTLVFLGAAALTLLCITVPRVAPLVAISLTAAFSVYCLVDDTRRDGWSAFKTVFFRPELLFAVWALIAVAWAPDPLRGLEKSLFLIALVLHAIILAKNFYRVDRRVVEWTARGVLAGVILGGFYVCFEIATRDGLTKLLLGHFPDISRAFSKHATIKDGVIVRISGAHITRASAVFCLLVCPALLAAALFTKGWVRWLCYGVIVAFLLLIFFHPYTHSQTAQLVIAVGATTTALAVVAPNLARWAVAAGLAAWLFLVMPAAIALHAYGLHEDRDLFASARVRVSIWKEATDEILKNPILGAGTTAARYFGSSKGGPQKSGKLDPERGARGRAHFHNAYLQTWYELGLIGILAFALLAYSLWRRISDVPRNAALFATTHFAVCTTLIGPSYGLWQNWLQSAFALSILMVMGFASTVANPDKRSTAPPPQEG